MIKFRKILFIPILALAITSCRSEEIEEEKTSKKDEIQIESDDTTKPVSTDIRINTTTFASDIIVDDLENTSKDSYDIVHVSDYESIEEGDFDIAVVPAVMAANLYNETGGAVQLAAITLLNNLYALSETEILSPKDLIGKTLLIPDLGDDYDKFIESKLSVAGKLLGISTLYYKNYDELVNLSKENESSVAIVSQPNLYKLSSKKDYKRYDFSEISPLFSKQNDEGVGDFISEVIIVKKKFAQDNKEYLDQFLKEYKNRVDDFKENGKISADTINAYDIKSDEALNIYNSMDTVFIDGDTMVGMYKVFLDSLSRVNLDLYKGDKPAEDFYYKK